VRNTEQLDRLKAKVIENKQMNLRNCNAVNQMVAARVEANKKEVHRELLSIGESPWNGSFQNPYEC
jgi:hypothetical protein